MVVPVGRLAGVIREEHAAGILLARGDQEDALPPLRKAEGSGVDNSVCPPEAEPPELGRQVPHPLTSIQLEHEGHVLEEQPRWVGVFEESEDVTDEPGASAIDPNRPSRLAQILTGEACGDEVDRRERPDLGHVVDDLDARKPGPQDSLSAGVDLTEELSPMASLMEPHLDTADARKQASDPEPGRGGRAQGGGRNHGA